MRFQMIDILDVSFELDPNRQLNLYRNVYTLSIDGAHFGVFAAMQDNAADRLHIEVAHAGEAAAGFADHGEGLR